MDPGQPKTLFDDQPAAATRPMPKPLTGQILRLHEALGQATGWLTIPELQELTGDPGNSLSANIRNLRKAEYSRNVVGRRRSGSPGTWEYRLIDGDDGQNPEAA